MNSHSLTIMTIGFLASTVLPLLVGLVTKINTRPGVKAVILLGCAAVTGLFTEYVNAAQGDEHYDWRLAVFTWGGSFLTAVGIHFGVWKPTGATGTVQRVGS